MLKTELHCHSSGPSVCADVTDEQLITEYKNAGYDAIILTNHINKTLLNYPADDYKGKVDYYFSAVERLKELGKKENVKVFFGAEIVTVTDDGVHQEFLLIGFDKQFLYDNDLVYKYSQKQLFELANKHNLFMCQTHPFRVGEKTGDPRYMHGAEGFNGHYHHDNNNEKAFDFCTANGLKIMAGNDYHHYKQPLISYMYIPEEIENERQLADYLLSTQPQLYFDQQKCLEERQKYKDGIVKTKE